MLTVRTSLITVFCSTIISNHKLLGSLGTQTQTFQLGDDSLLAATMCTSVALVILEIAAGIPEMLLVSLCRITLIVSPILCVTELLLVGFQGIDSLLTVLPGDQILLVSPIYLGEKVWKPGFDPEFDQRSVEVVRELQFAYRKLAGQKGIRMLAASDFAIPSEIDQQHMTPEGHAALAEAICANIQAMNSHEPGNTIERLASAFL